VTVVHNFDCECIELTQIVSRLVSALKAFCLKKKRIIFREIYAKCGIFAKNYGEILRCSTRNRLGPNNAVLQCQLAVAVVF